MAHEGRKGSLKMWIEEQRGIFPLLATSQKAISRKSKRPRFWRSTWHSLIGHDITIYSSLPRVPTIPGLANSPRKRTSPLAQCSRATYSLSRVDTCPLQSVSQFLYSQWKQWWRVDIVWGSRARRSDRILKNH